MVFIKPPSPSPFRCLTANLNALNSSAPSSAYAPVCGTLNPNVTVAESPGSFAKLSAAHAFFVKNIGVAATADPACINCLRVIFCLSLIEISFNLNN